MRQKIADRFHFPCFLFVAALAARLAHGADFKFATQTFTVPDGFTVEQVAGPPLVNRPIMADFDEQGRLYVADSSGATGSAQQQAKDKPHRMVRLEDTTGNGRFDKALVFAEGLMFPEGVLCYEGAVYYSGVPSIWKLEDTDGDGVADKRTEWYQGKTMTGCANDLHGPYLGPDGYIYWCKGAFAEQTHEVAAHKVISDSAAHIFRCRPDGTDFDSIMSGGMDNPVEIAFTPAGEAIFTTTFFVNPAGGQRDALVHAIYGGVYPKVHGVLDGLKRTGDLLPAMTHLGPAAPSGLARYTPGVFGEDYRNNLFSAQFNLHKVQRHILEPVGATYRTKDIDFMVSDNPDFHPTDVLEDADGSLLVIDTGGWYKVCCPTSQIAKPEVLGAIYRVRRQGVPRMVDPRGLKLDWAAMESETNPEGLARLLGDPRTAVQNRAIARLSKKGDAAVPTAIAILKTGKNPQFRLNAVWVLTRVPTARALEGLRLASKDPDPTVQQAAVHASGLLRDSAAAPDLIELLKSGNSHLAMTAATSLGQIGDHAAVPALLEAASGTIDRTLEHSLIYALIELDDRDATARGLTSMKPSVQRIALIALDQMEHGASRAEDATRALNSREPVLETTALWVASHHPEWGGALTGYFEKRLREESVSQSASATLQPNTGSAGIPAGEKSAREAARDELQNQLSHLAQNDAIQGLMGRLVDDPKTKPETRLLLLRAMKAAPLRSAQASWANALLTALANSDEATVRAALEAARALTLPKANAHALTAAILEIAGRPACSDNLKLEALRTLPGSLSPVAPGVFAFLTTQLDANRPAMDRAGAAEILGRSKLSGEQLFALTDFLKPAGPLELSKLLTAYDGSTNEALGLKLVETLEHAKGRAALRPDTLAPRLAKFPETVQQRGNALLLALNANVPKQKQRLDDLEAGLALGERNRGQALFSGAKAACFTCHAIGYVGGHIGPDLTKVGSIRTQRDLIEAIVYPSASFARGYESMFIATRGGEEYSGIVRDETADSLTLVSGPTSEQKIARADVVEIRPGTVSVMPEGFADQLSRQELADLITFLKSLK